MMLSSEGGLHELQLWALQRANTYGFLAALYIKPPDQSLLASLGEFLTSDDSEAQPAEPLPDRLVKALEAIRGFARGLNREALEGAATLLGVEFTRLFRGIRRGECRPPYESVYREGTISGACSSRVNAWYRRFGLDLTSSFEGEPPDHIAFELDFMRNLCNKEAEANGRGIYQEACRLLQAQKEFLDEHLLMWVGEFCSEVKEHDGTGFYKGVAELTEGWLWLDRHQIDDLIAIMNRMGRDGS